MPKAEAQRLPHVGQETKTGNAATGGSRGLRLSLVTDLAPFLPLFIPVSLKCFNGITAGFSPNRSITGEAFKTCGINVAELQDAM